MLKKKGFLGKLFALAAAGLMLFASCDNGLSSSEEKASLNSDGTASVRIYATINGNDSKAVFIPTEYTTDDISNISITYADENKSDSEKTVYSGSYAELVNGTKKVYPNSTLNVAATVSGLSFVDTVNYGSEKTITINLKPAADITTGKLDLSALKLPQSSSAKIGIYEGNFPVDGWDNLTAIENASTELEEGNYSVAVFAYDADNKLVAKTFDTVYIQKGFTTVFGVDLSNKESLKTLVKVTINSNNTDVISNDVIWVASGTLPELPVADGYVVTYYTDADRTVPFTATGINESLTIYVKVVEYHKYTWTFAETNGDFADEMKAQGIGTSSVDTKRAYETYYGTTDSVKTVALTLGDAAGKATCAPDGTIVSSGSVNIRYYGTQNAITVDGVTSSKGAVYGKRYIFKLPGLKGNVKITAIVKGGSNNRGIVFNTSAEGATPEKTEVSAEAIIVKEYSFGDTATDVFIGATDNIYFFDIIVETDKDCGTQVVSEIDYAELKKTHWTRKWDDESGAAKYTAAKEAGVNGYWTGYEEFNAKISIEKPNTDETVTAALTALETAYAALVPYVKPTDIEISINGSVQTADQELNPADLTEGITVTAAEKADGDLTPTGTVTITVTGIDGVTFADGVITGITGDTTGTLVITAKDTDERANVEEGVNLTKVIHISLTKAALPKADAPLETAFTITHAAASDLNGKIAGITPAMEYKIGDSEEWISGTGAEVEAAPGKVYVRVKEVEGVTQASDYVELTVDTVITYPKTNTWTFTNSNVPEYYTGVVNTTQPTSADESDAYWNKGLTVLTSGSNIPWMRGTNNYVQSAGQGPILYVENVIGPVKITTEVSTTGSANTNRFLLVYASTSLETLFSAENLIAKEGDEAGIPSSKKSYITEYKKANNNEPVYIGIGAVDEKAGTGGIRVYSLKLEANADFTENYTAQFNAYKTKYKADYDNESGWTAESYSTFKAAYEADATTATADTVTALKNAKAGLVIKVSAEVNNSTVNNVETLGFVGKTASSSNEAVVTVDVADGKIAITSVGAGSATVTVKDDAGRTVTIPVTVSATGAITLGTITPWADPTNSAEWKFSTIVTTGIEGSTGRFDSTDEKYSLYVDATNGKLGASNGSWSQFNTGTKLYVPAKVGDVVSVTAYTATTYTVGGVVGTGDQTAKEYVVTAVVASGVAGDTNTYVVVESTSNGYIGDISIKTSATGTEAIKELTTVVWDFDTMTKEQATFEKSTGYVTTIANEKGYVLNVDATTGKLEARGSQWAQFTTGAKISVPVLAGDVVTAKIYQDTGATIDGIEITAEKNSVTAESDGYIDIISTRDDGWIGKVTLQTASEGLAIHTVTFKVPTDKGTWADDTTDDIKVSVFHGYTLPSTSVPEPKVTAEGEKFSGWKLGEDDFDLTTVIDRDIELTANIGASVAQVQTEYTNTGDSSKLYDGMSFTINGNAIAGAGGWTQKDGDISAKGLKLRVTPNNDSSKHLVINVKTGYKILSVKLLAGSNDSSKLMDITGCYIDNDTTNQMSSSITLGAKSTTSVISVTNINATSSIEFTIDNAATTQYCAVVIVDYVKL